MGVHLLSADDLLDCSNILGCQPLARVLAYMAVICSMLLSVCAKMTPEWFVNVCKNLKTPSCCDYSDFHSQLKLSNCNDILQYQAILSQF